MASWASSGPRILMNDANRHRYSNMPPSFENNPISVGPAAYNPAKSPRSTTAHLTMLKTLDGVPERVREIYGVPVKKILPIHALSYDTLHSDFDKISHDGPHPQAGFSSHSPRQLWARTDTTIHPEEYPPGPNSYSLPPIEKQSSVSRVRNVFYTTEPRESNSPVQKELPPMLDASRLSSPHASYSPMNLSTSRSPSNNKTPARAPLGVSIGHSPRHFNIINLNSPVKREHDPDYDNPPPGHYDAKLRHKGQKV